MKMKSKLFPQSFYCSYFSTASFTSVSVANCKTAFAVELIAMNRKVAILFLFTILSLCNGAQFILKAGVASDDLLGESYEQLFSTYCQVRLTLLKILQINLKCLLGKMHDESGLRRYQYQLDHWNLFFGFWPWKFNP